MTRLHRTSEPWVPLPYMQRAVDFLATHYSAGLPLKPGGRKTSITLAAFQRLRQEGKARTMLVVAPLRVARQVWRQEAAKWDQFRDLEFALVAGDVKSRTKALKSGADVYLINYENLVWLAKQYVGRPLPFDVVVFDELTKMKNSQAERHKAIRPRIAAVRYRWGLTGSLFSKGHLGIFGQQLILDDGAALGRYMTHFRDTYFTPSFNGFDYDLLPGAEGRITDKLAPYWFYMDEADYAQLPPIIDVPHIADMESQARALYNHMQREMIAQLPGGVVTAANAGACYSKLSQMANGTVYRTTEGGQRETEEIHSLKLDMLEELVDELDGEPLLVAYEFNSDLERIQTRFGGKLPYLGKGTTPKQETEWVAAWNRRELPVLLAHPQSAGHGLNMQEGQAYNVCWFSVTWDWELYDQFIRRVRRSGNEQARIFNHLLTIRGTIDEEKLAAVQRKDFTEQRLMASLNSQIEKETDMVVKLTRPEGAAAPAASGWGAAPAQPAAAPALAQGAPTGWGRPAEASSNPAPAQSAWGAQPDETAAQRQRIQEQIAPRDRAAEAQSAFSGGVSEAVQAVAQADYGTAQSEQQQAQPSGPTGWGATPAKPRRSRAAAKAEPDVDLSEAIRVGAANTIIAARARVVAAVLASSPDLTVSEVIDISRELMAYVAETED